MAMMTIKRNAFKCKKCGEIVESKSVHDFQTCKCGNYTDGGHDYVCRGGNLEDMEDMSEPHSGGANSVELKIKEEK